MDTTPQPLPQPVQPETTNTLSWFKTLAYGFSLVSFGITIGIVGAILRERESRVVLIPKNDNSTYRLSLYGKTISNYNNLFDKILSPFKFTDQK